jgi:hypothetical protein
MPRSGGRNGWHRAMLPQTPRLPCSCPRNRLRRKPVTHCWRKCSRCRFRSARRDWHRCRNSRWAASDTPAMRAPASACLTRASAPASSRLLDWPSSTRCVSSGLPNRCHHFLSGHSWWFGFQRPSNGRQVDLGRRLRDRGMAGASRQHGASQPHNRDDAAIRGECQLTSLACLKCPMPRVASFRRPTPPAPKLIRAPDRPAPCRLRPIRKGSVPVANCAIQASPCGR